MKKRVLLVGGGGREHALAWAIARSPGLEMLRCAPGNAGIAEQAECLPISATDVDALVEHVAAEGYDLVVVGPEAPLVAGLADRLHERGVAVFGCSAAAAQIEGSKVFAKRFMERHGIPTARFRVCSRLDEVEAFLDAPEFGPPLVVKADGLAAGKGVIMAPDREAVLEAARGMLLDRKFGDAGTRVLLEEQLVGREISFFVLADGERFVELETCQDYKRALDGDGGLNTGGMGTYSPSAYLDEDLRRAIVDRVVAPTIRGMAAEERPYRGVLYVGLMIADDGPKVLEYNARFGDPEAQVLMPRLDGDWLAVLHDCATGRLSGEPLRFVDDATVCVVMTAGGYPGAYAKGRAITGLDAARELDGVVVFHAGTKLDDEGRTVTSGGRVLGVTARGRDLAGARSRAYEAVARIRFDDEHHRTDIAADAVARIQAE